MRLLIGILRDKARAEEILQETFIAAFRSVARFRGEVSILSWLARIATNRAYNVLRDESRQKRTAPPPGNEAVSRFEPQVEGRDLARKVIGILDQMDPSKKLALLLQAEGCTVAEIAEISAEPRGTILARLSRSRAELSLRMAEAGLVTQEKLASMEEHIMSDCLSLRERFFAPGSVQRPRVDGPFAGLPGVPAGPPGHCRSWIARSPNWRNGRWTCRASRQSPEAAQSAARTQRRRQTVRRSVPFLYTGLVDRRGCGRIRGHDLDRPRPLGRAQAACAGRRDPRHGRSQIRDSRQWRSHSPRRWLAQARYFGQAETHKPCFCLWVESFSMFPSFHRDPRSRCARPMQRFASMARRFQVIRTGKDTQVNVVEGVVEVRPEGIGRPVQSCMRANRPLSDPPRRTVRD